MYTDGKLSGNHGASIPHYVSESQGVVAGVSQLYSHQQGQTSGHVSGTKKIKKLRKSIDTHLYD
jgi:hypothetical protein